MVALLVENEAAFPAITAALQAHSHGIAVSPPAALHAAATLQAPVSEITVFPDPARSRIYLVSPANFRRFLAEALTVAVSIPSPAPEITKPVSALVIQGIHPLIRLDRTFDASILITNIAVVEPVIEITPAPSFTATALTASIIVMPPTIDIPPPAAAPVCLPWSVGAYIDPERGLCG